VAAPMPLEAPVMRMTLFWMGLFIKVDYKILFSAGWHGIYSTTRMSIEFYPQISQMNAD
jgi:hypothetical protein